MRKRYEDNEFHQAARACDKREDLLDSPRWKEAVSKSQAKSIIALCATMQPNARFWAKVAIELGVEPKWLLDRRHPRKGCELVVWVREQRDRINTATVEFTNEGGEDD